MIEITHKILSEKTYHSFFMTKEKQIEFIVTESTPSIGCTEYKFLGTLTSNSRDSVLSVYILFPGLQLIITAMMMYGFVLHQVVPQDKGWVVIFKGEVKK